jgi:hypothetical protein
MAHVPNPETLPDTRLLNDLIEAAEKWRDTIVRSNTPAAGYLIDDPDGVTYWRQIDNHNGRLVQAVDAIRAQRASETIDRCVADASRVCGNRLSMGEAYGVIRCALKQGHRGKCSPRAKGAREGQ